LGLARGVDDVEDIARDKEDVDLLVGDHIREARKPYLVLRVARPSAQGLIQMPISSMKEAYRCLNEK